MKDTPNHFRNAFNEIDQNTNNVSLELNSKIHNANDVIAYIRNKML